jgi:phytanoyl-CoA hydroxylase
MNVTGLRAEFERDGYLVLPEFCDAESVASVRERAASIVEAFDPSVSRATFSTRDESQKSEAYFLESGDKIRCFFEEEAFDAGGALRGPKAVSINKIGHALHDLDPVFERFSRDARLDALARELGVARPRVYQSMYIFKQPHIGGEVRWHQDATYFVTEPNSVITLWFALDARAAPHAAAGTFRRAGRHGHAGNARRDAVASARARATGRSRGGDARGDARAPAPLQRTE